MRRLSNWNHRLALLSLSCVRVCACASAKTGYIYIVIHVNFQNIDATINKRTIKRITYREAVVTLIILLWQVVEWVVACEVCIAVENQRRVHTIHEAAQRGVLQVQRLAGHWRAGLRRRRHCDARDHLQCRTRACCSARQLLRAQLRTGGQVPHIARVA